MVPRFAASSDEDLIKAMYDCIAANIFAMRSQAIRHLVEKSMVEEKWKCDSIVAGAVVLVFNHYKKEILKKSSTIQFEFTNFVRSVKGFYLNNQNYMGIIAVKKSSKKLPEISDKLIDMKGIHHGKLVMSASK